ncbi:DUF45 domain-containing protein [Pseudodesulfovibrio cashew]|uniref:DUF45 domain-containing protein n=1 Tax=Pseudodesulfovibrio cashew TaxID=2678688 RepID=A0A6I6JFJ8_9BACT|nr:SprT family zinc-dependent metalloprotease [Pseudodesulfovibrio cashew]QGY39850.1 DUF45 domain-containing protein [Pseudodesulfovibrio cashew]
MTRYLGLPLTVRSHPRAKRVLVKLVPGRGLEVVVPKRFDTAQVPAILEDKRPWIERTRAQLEARGADLSGRTPEPPGTIRFTACDREYAVAYADRPGRVTLSENASRLMVAGPAEDAEGRLEVLRRFTARKAREFLLPRLESQSARTGLSYAALRVRRQRTRWGSCSARGTISVNAKLLFLPVELADHLLLHELCHTRHLNHSPAYWALVASFEPDWQRLEKELTRGYVHVPEWFL